VSESEEPDEGLGLDRGSVVDEIVFGTASLGEIDWILNRFCATCVGAGVREVLLRTTSVGAVTAVLLDDGRRVVVKGHRPRETLERLRAVQEIQGALYRAGLPCPEPLGEPSRLVHGFATVETFIDEGELRDTHDPGCRELIAQALAWHMQITESRPTPEALAGGWNLFAGEGLWPASAHSPVFDFPATSTGAEWIDAIATQAKLLTEPADQRPADQRLAGHSDWSGKHFRFADGRITAIYDWDSLSVRTEAAIVGVAAMTFSTRFDLPAVRRYPTPDEMNAFIDAYSAARQRPLNRAERKQTAAHALLLAA
jgi:Phosphotransferase enzyme family